MVALWTPSGGAIDQHIPAPAAANMAQRHGRERCRLFGSIIGHFSRPFEPTGLFDRLIVRVLEADMSERRITQLFGLILGGLFTFGLVLNAFAF
jgi:hypothetical protein